MMSKKSTVPTSRESDKFVLRMPDGMRDEIAERAKASGRSMNAEIVYRLQRTFEEYAEFADQDGVRHINDLGRHLVHDVVLTDPNIPPKWNPDFIEEMREVLDFVRNEMRNKGSDK